MFLANRELDSGLSEFSYFKELQFCYTPCPKKIVPFFLFFFLGAQCVESGEVALIATRYS